MKMTTKRTSAFASSTLQNAHPGIDLGRTLERLAKLRENDNGKLSFTRPELKRALGFQSDSGFATRVISALLHFGVLERIDAVYLYTELGSNLASADPGSNRYTQLLQESFTNPEMYRWLYDTYGSELPKGLESILIDKFGNRNVNGDNIKEIISNYMKSLALVTKRALRQNPAPSDLDEDIEVSFRDTTFLISKKYLSEAIRKTNEDKLASLI
jgi:hypothetical protein